MNIWKMFFGAKATRVYLSPRDLLLEVSEHINAETKVIIDAVTKKKSLNTAQVDIATVLALQAVQRSIHKAIEERK